SGLCIGLPPRPLDLAVRLLGQLGGLAEQLDGRVGVGRRLELRTPLLEPVEELRRVVERVHGGHAAASAATRPRMPFTSRAASGDAYRLARPTASAIATSGGTVAPSSSEMPIRRMLRSSTPSRSAGQPSETSSIRRSSSAL